MITGGRCDSMKKVLCIIMIGLLVLSFVYHESQWKEKLTTSVIMPQEQITEKPKIALTFDDGPHPYFTEQLLDGLKQRGVCATFFMMGKNAEENPEIVKRVAEEGHLIGNHSYSHAELTKLSMEERCAELSKTYNLIYELTGLETDFVRPPFGEWEQSYDCNVDMIPVMWTIDTRDWTTEDADLIVSRVIGKEKENDIILMHDYYESSVQAALRIADYLSEQGYDLVTVDEILMP